MLNEGIFKNYEQGKENLFAESGVEPAAVQVVDLTESSPDRPAKKTSSRVNSLSKWGKRLLAPRKEVPNIKEVPVEPLRDFILEDFKEKSENHDSSVSRGAFLEIQIAKT